MGFLSKVRSALDNREDKRKRRMALEDARRDATPKRKQESTFSKLTRNLKAEADRTGLTGFAESLGEAAKSGKQATEKLGRSARRTKRKSDRGQLSELPSGDLGLGDDGFDDMFAEDNDDLFNNDDLRL